MSINVPWNVLSIPVVFCIDIPVSFQVSSPLVRAIAFPVLLFFIIIADVWLVPCITKLPPESMTTAVTLSLLSATAPSMATSDPKVNVPAVIFNVLSDIDSVSVLFPDPDKVIFDVTSASF